MLLHFFPLDKHQGVEVSADGPGTVAAQAGKAAGNASLDTLACLRLTPLLAGAALLTPGVLDGLQFLLQGLNVALDVRTQPLDVARAELLCSSFSR